MAALLLLLNGLSHQNSIFLLDLNFSRNIVFLTDILNFASLVMLCYKGMFVFEGILMFMNIVSAAMAVLTVSATMADHACGRRWLTAL